MTADERSYQVSFERLETELAGLFLPRWTLADGIRQCRDAFEGARLSSAWIEGRLYTRIAQLEYLVGSGRLDDDLRWAARSTTPGNPKATAP